MHDPNYYGFYRGTVVSSKDPLKKGRIRFTCPQVYGKEVSDWAWPVTGAPGQNRMPYGIFSSSSTQTVNSAAAATFTTTEDSTSISLRYDSRLRVEEGGDYFLQFSAQFAKTGGSSGQADVWIAKNGVDIPNTRSRVTLQGNPNEVLVTLNYILDLDATDYIEIKTAAVGGATGITLAALTDNPSIIASLNLVGKYMPSKGSPVWVAFEGGDPNFPIWIGTF